MYRGRLKYIRLCWYSTWYACTGSSTWVQACLDKRGRYYCWLVGQAHPRWSTHTRLAKEKKSFLRSLRASCFLASLFLLLNTLYFSSLTHYILSHYRDTPFHRGCLLVRLVRLNTNNERTHICMILACCNPPPVRSEVFVVRCCLKPPPVWSGVFVVRCCLPFFFFFLFARCHKHT